MTQITNLLRFCVHFISIYTYLLIEFQFKLVNKPSIGGGGSWAYAADTEEGGPYMSAPGKPCIAPELGWGRLRIRLS